MDVKINLSHQKIKFPMILMKSDVLKSFWKITKTKLIIYFLRFRSKSDPDPHTSIFDRFRRTRAPSPSQTSQRETVYECGHAHMWASYTKITNIHIWFHVCDHMRALIYEQSHTITHIGVCTKIALIQFYVHVYDRMRAIICEPKIALICEHS